MIFVDCERLGSRASAHLSRSTMGARLYLLLFIGLLMGFGMTPARAGDGPTVLKNTIQVGVWQISGAWASGAKEPDFRFNSWFPQVLFRVRGPVPGGSQFVIDFTRPDGSLWAQIDCPTDEIGADQWTEVTTRRDTSPAAEKKYTKAEGTFGFKIRLKNELSGQNQTLYTGKFTVGKVSKYNGTPVTKTKYDYFVNHDWTLPIGYLWFKPDTVVSPFSATMWFKGDTNGADLAAYLFYKGKQIGSTKEMGSASTTEAEVGTVNRDAGDPAWRSWILTWYNVAETPTDPNNPNERLFYMAKNPGEYEIKVLRRGSLTRVAAFTVGEDGKIRVPGVAGEPDKAITADRWILPVKVVGTLDGSWTKTAWQTDAYYGNPLKGVTLTP